MLKAYRGINLVVQFNPSGTAGLKKGASVDGIGRVKA